MRIAMFGVCVFTWFSIAACTPITAEMVREAPPEKRFSFIANENYQPVYRKVLEQIRKCYEMSAGSLSTKAQADLYSDIRTGTISVAAYGGFALMTTMVIDIVAIDDGRTTVSGAYHYDAYTRVPIDIRAWALDNSKECEHPKST